jgi:hypothetical protein
MATRTLGLLYDTHVYSGSRRSDNAEQYTKTAIDKLNSVGVDFTVHGGDLRPFGSVTSPDKVDWGGWDGSDNPYYEADFGVIKDLLETRLNSDYYLVRGNHDRPLPIVKEYFPPEQYSPSDDLGNTEHYFGVEETGGARYIYLDSNPTEGYHAEEQNQQFVSAPQISMISRLMNADPDIPTFVFSHAMLVPHGEVSGSITNTTFNTGREASYFQTRNSLSVRAALEEGNGATKMVNTGHYNRHVGQNSGRGSRNLQLVSGSGTSIEYVTAGHLAPAGGDVRWLTVDTTNNTAEVNYYHVGSDTQGTITSISW